jgi:dihydrofolate reductase
MAIAEDGGLKQWKLDGISNVGAHLMGRATYQEVSSYWPRSQDPYAAPMNDIPKVVFSKTLNDAEATWPVTRSRGAASRPRSPPSRTSPARRSSSGAGADWPVRWPRQI